MGWIPSLRLCAARPQDAQSSALLKRFGTADQDAIRQLAEAYAKLWEARDAAQANANAKSAAADTLYNSLSSNEQAILLEVRRFAPAPSTSPRRTSCCAPAPSAGRS